MKCPHEKADVNTASALSYNHEGRTSELFFTHNIYFCQKSKLLALWFVADIGNRALPTKMRTSAACLRGGSSKAYHARQDLAYQKRICYRIEGEARYLGANVEKTAR